MPRAKTFVAPIMHTFAAAEIPLCRTGLRVIPSSLYADGDLEAGMMLTGPINPDGGKDLKLASRLKLFVPLG